VSGEVIATGRPVVLTDASSDYRVNQPQVRLRRIGPATTPARAAVDTAATTCGHEPSDGVDAANLDAGPAGGLRLLWSAPVVS
jgi:hypothetical protein